MTAKSYACWLVAAPGVTREYHNPGASFHVMATLPDRLASYEKNAALQIGCGLCKRRPL